MSQSPQTYSFTARLLHWGVALVIFILFGLAIAMDNAPQGPERAALYGWHKSFGLLALALVAVRLLARFVQASPPPADVLSPLMKQLSRVAHGALYALLIIVPALGVAGSVAYGYPPSFFGLFSVPQFMEVNKELAEQLMERHELAAWTLAAIMAAHIAGGFYHLVRKDGVFGRMWRGA